MQYKEKAISLLSDLRASESHDARFALMKWLASNDTMWERFVGVLEGICLHGNSPYAAPFEFRCQHIALASAAEVAEAAEFVIDSMTEQEAA